MATLLDKLYKVKGYIEPLSEEWWQARRGRITASSRMKTALYGGIKAITRLLDNMEKELEDDFEWPKEFKGKYTEHGRRFEKQALDEYVMATTLEGDITDPGFIVHPDIQILGCTPDFYQGDNITGQIKCPVMQDRHFQNVYTGINPAYVVQVNCEALVSNRGLIVYVSYWPKAEAEAQLYYTEIIPDKNLQKRMLVVSGEIQTHLEKGTRPVDPNYTELGIPKIF